LARTIHRDDARCSSTGGVTAAARLQTRAPANPISSAATPEMTDTAAASFIIVGITRQGAKFRPSDWAERLCGVMSAFGAEKRMKYSPLVRPCTFDSEKAVFIDGQLATLEPLAFKFMQSFAADNDLRIVEQQAAYCEIGENGVINCKPV
jgi:hypothetical protein